jgi:hypothetical protein
VTVPPPLAPPPAAPAAMVDPIGTVVAVVTAVDPTLGRDEVRRVVEQVSGGRAKRRRLATALTGDASVLSSGRSPAPRVVGDLLLALRAAGATRISPPWCTSCGRELSAMQLRGQDWYCSPCYTRPQPCASCGQHRQVTFRDRHGRPRCSQCPDHDDRDPRQVLIGIITTLDPGLGADAVTTAITTTLSKPAHAQKLAWAIQAAPELLTGDGAKAPFPMVLRLIDALRDAGATRIQPPACPRCRRVVALSKRRDGLRICRNCCARANAVPCSGCGTVREPAARDAQGGPLCPNCLVRDPLNLQVCVRCQRRQRVNTRGPEGPICAGCVPRVTATCSVCARTATCMVSKTTGQPWCRACARAWMRCSRCRQWDAIRAGTRDAPLCAGCAVPDPSFWTTCPGCGTGGRLIAGVCRRCRLHRQLGEVLADSTGQIRAELQALHDALATADRPDTITSWLTRPTVRSVLVDLATGRRPLTHATLDDLPPSKAVEHLRSVLVATAVLPARDEQLARLQRWVTRTLTERTDPRDRELLRRYAVWHELRRIRQRNRGTETTYGQFDMVRQRLRGAIGFLDWLRTRGLTFSSCRQPDLEAWLTSNDASHRAEVGHFVRWAISQRINPDLRFATTRWTGPARPLDQQQRWEQAKRLLHDDGLDTNDRVAGLLVLLYAQRLAAISRLTLDDIDTSGDTVELHLGTVPVMLPEPLATLVRDLAATRHGHAATGDHGTSQWLFPGGQPGRPVSADRLGERLHLLGIRPGQARSTALFQLATEIPAAVLARMLGIHIKVAVQWQHVSAGDWTSYAADVSRRTADSQRAAFGQF